MLLDTCALIWLAEGGGRLSEYAKQALREANTVYVSSISAFEIAYAHDKGKIELPCDPERWYPEVLARHDVTEIRLSGKIAVAAARLPKFHKDPCDRFIIATARLKGLTVVTADRKFEKYDVTLMS